MNFRDGSVVVAVSSGCAGSGSEATLLRTILSGTMTGDGNAGGVLRGDGSTEAGATTPVGARCGASANVVFCSGAATRANRFH